MSPESFWQCVMLFTCKLIGVSSLTDAIWVSREEASWDCPTRCLPRSVVTTCRLLMENTWGRQNASITTKFGFIVYLRPCTMVLNLLHFLNSWVLEQLITFRRSEFVPTDGFHSIFSLGNWRALHHHAPCWLVNIHVTWSFCPPISVVKDAMESVYWVN